MLSTVFVSEYLCSGGCPLAESEPSLLAEGTAMLEAVLSDLLQIPGIQVRTCVQPGLLTAPKFQQAEQEQRLYIQRVNQPEAEPESFRQACQQADLVWVIAPEFDDLLLTRTRWAVETGACVLGPDPTTIQLTSDKWQLYQVLQRAGIPTIETALLSEAAELPARFPCLVKHRWGAGGMG
jgi:predicted ATP-grasp superfamily ATP-dependent carboligase